MLQRPGLPPTCAGSGIPARSAGSQALAADACWLKVPLIGPPCRAAVIWAFNIGLLLAARLGNGFRFAALGPWLALLDSHRWGCLLFAVMMTRGGKMADPGSSPLAAC